MLSFHSRTKSLRLGFTLIELLIVVAIIAILAAIAVPNFMEAQVRAKVSRVKNDHRTMATAIESYAVDYNRPPLGVQELSRVGLGAGLGWAEKEYISQAFLTTPVAYLNSILLDPFFTENRDKDGRHTYVYHGYVHPDLTGTHKKCKELGYTWATMSRGPANPEFGIQKGIQSHLTGATDAWAYDPTNGTRSIGAIIRTNKGIFSTAGQ